MPSDSKDKKKSSSSSKDKEKSESKSESSSSSKDKDKERAKSSSSSSSSSSSKSADDIRAEEWDTIVVDCIHSHAGYLSPLILSLSSSLSIPPLTTTIILILIFLFAHLYLPLYLLPHISAFVTLIIPLQNTLQCIRAPSSKDDSSQWLVYWLVYALLDGLKASFRIWRPGYNGLFELGRSAALVVLGSGWYGRKALRPDGPSKALVEAEKREADREKRKSAERGKPKKDE